MREPADAPNPEPETSEIVCQTTGDYLSVYIYFLPWPYCWHFLIISVVCFVILCPDVFCVLALPRVLPLYIQYLVGHCPCFFLMLHINKGMGLGINDDDK